MAQQTTAALKWLQESPSSVTCAVVPSIRSETLSLFCKHLSTPPAIQRDRRSKRVHLNRCITIWDRLPCSHPLWTPVPTICQLSLYRPLSRQLAKPCQIKTRLKPSPGPLRSGPSLVPRVASFSDGGYVSKVDLHNEESNFDTQEDEFEDTSEIKIEEDDSKAEDEEKYEASNAERCQGGFDSVYQQTIGVDLGDRRTGVAISWGDVGAPRTLQVLQLAPDQLITTLLDLAETEGADEIVVGLPLSVEGTESKQALKSRFFAEKLAAAAYERQVRVYLFDEALTSKDAMSYMIKAGVKRKARSATLDSMAAAVLLESYFRDKGRRAERVFWQPNGGATSQSDNQVPDSKYS